MTGAQIDVDDDTSVGVTGLYMITDNIGIELLASTPFQHDISVGGTQIGSTEHLPPTLSAQWHFNSDGDVHPYVGLGLNYTNFFNEDANGAAVVVADDNSFSGPITDIDLDDFVSAAQQALPHMSALSSNATLINPNNLTVIEGLLSTTFRDISVMYNDTGDLGLTLSEYSDELAEISSHFLGVADAWLAAGNALAVIWSNNPFVIFGPWIIMGTAAVVITILYVIYYVRGKPSQ